MRPRSRRNADSRVWHQSNPVREVGGYGERWVIVIFYAVSTSGNPAYKAIHKSQGWNGPADASGDRRQDVRDLLAKIVGAPAISAYWRIRLADKTFDKRVGPLSPAPLDPPDIAELAEFGFMDDEAFLLWAPTADQLVEDLQLALRGFLTKWPSVSKPVAGRLAVSSSLPPCTSSHPAMGGGRLVGDELQDAMQ